MPDTESSNESIPSLDPTTVPEVPKRPPVVVTDQHKDAFFKAFLADRAYQEEFLLLGGNYRIVLRSLTMKENSDLLRQIAYDRELGRIEKSPDYYFSRVAHYRLGLSLISVNDKPLVEGPEAPADPKAGTSYVSARAELFENWSMAKLAAVQSVLMEFDQRVISLIGEVSQPGFWKAAA